MLRRSERFLLTGCGRLHGQVGSVCTQLWAGNMSEAAGSLPVTSWVAVGAHSWSAHGQWQLCVARYTRRECRQQSSFGWWHTMLRWHSTSPLQIANMGFLGLQ